MSTTAAIAQTVRAYTASSAGALSHGHVIRALNPFNALRHLFLTLYILVQRLFIIALFKQRPPKTAGPLPRPSGRIAIIGAGLTGVSSAAHCISHNFEVVIFEKKKRVGGIWADVNSTSALQLNSLIYRFHPAVLWKHTYPSRDEILSEISRIWKEYKLETRTRFNTPVHSVRRYKDTQSPGAQWIVNGGDDGPFDGVIITIGTCGKPQMAGFPGMPRTHWADEEEKEDTVTKEARRKLAAKEDRSYHGSFSIYPGPQPSKNDSERKRKEMEKKEKERREKEQRERERRRREGRGNGDGGPSFAEVAHRPPAEDSVAINDAPEGESLASPNAEDGDAESETGLWEETEEDHASSLDKQLGSENGAHEDSENENKDNANDGNDDGEVYNGTVLHSSELDNAKLADKTVLIIGSGASGVEAAETALARGAQKVVIVARDDKWIIPRNTFIDTLISAQPFGKQMPLSFLWEWFICVFHYRDLKDLSPANAGIYEGTPIVNSAFLDHIRAKRIDYVRGDTERLTTSGVLVNVRPRGTNPGSKPSSATEFKGEVVVLATGFKRPGLDFLPQDLFPDGYDRPNLYLQNFSTVDWTVLCTNSAYTNAIGTVGHIHIGIYTRILLLFLLDPDARPEERDMQLWVNVIRFVKRGARGGALGFFTYMELVIWFLTFHLFRPDRLRWILFTMQGWGIPIQD